MLLTVLFSISVVAASENSTDEVSLIEDNSYDMLSTVKTVDLSLDISVKSSYEDNQYNKVGSNVPWTITVTAKGGTAQNVKVRSVLSPSLKYISHNLTKGSYDFSSGMWDIGNLYASDTSSLIILTKLTHMGKHTIKAYAITDSLDSNMKNNFKFNSIETGSSKITSNITETSDDLEGASHTDHYGSRMEDTMIDYSDDSDSHSKVRKKSDDLKEEYGNGFIKKDLKISSVVKSIIPSNSTSNNSSNFHFNALKSIDYTRTPILIFLAFLLILFCIVFWDKIKSKF